MRPLALLLIAPLLLVGCASTSVDDGRIHIVASTNVYGSIAQTIGGALVDVTSIVTDPAQDPHSVDVGARTQLELSRADLVIENGAGYDDYVDTLLAGSQNSTAAVITVAEVSGYAVTPTFNEHLWYDLPTMRALVARIAQELGVQDPSHAAQFTANATELTAAIAGLETREAAAAVDLKGRSVVITEPVPLYLLTALGLNNVTPIAFSNAIEEGNDVPPAALNDVLTLLSTKTVAALIYNEQTQTSQTELVKAAATAAGVPIVGVTETIPTAGQDYVSWFDAELDSVIAAVAA